MFKNLFYVFRFNPGEVRKGISLEVLHGILVAIPTGMLFYIIRELMKEQPDSGRIWACILILSGLMIVQFFIASKAMIAATTMVFTISNEIRIRLGNHLQKLSFGYYKQRDPGDLTSVILQDVANFEMIFSHTIGNILSAIIGTLLVFSFLLANDWRLALVLISAVLIVFPLMIATNYFIHKLGVKQVASRNATGARFLEYVQGIRYIKAFGMTGTRFKVLDTALDNLRRESIKLEAQPGPLVMLSGIIFELVYLLMLWLGLTFFTHHTLTASSLIAFLIIGYRLYEPLKIILIDYALLRYMNISLSRITEIFEVPFPAVTDPHTPASFDIRFQKVTFGYTDRPVLKDLSFHAPEKSMTALVGASGTGKSTITALIARFWDVQQGAVSIGNVNVKHLPQQKLYEYISEVFQDVYLFNDTLYNNIKIGKPDATEVQILEAAKRAQVLEFAEELPEGLQTLAGEGGNRLSGGQKQRISIARALLKDAPIVLLDEATASLDPENEIYIQQAIQELVKDKTVIVIAHKLATIKHAQQILVLSDGTISEAGTHDTLLQLNGIYKKLWDTQQKVSGWKIKS